MVFGLWDGDTSAQCAPARRGGDSSRCGVDVFESMRKLSKLKNFRSVDRRSRMTCAKIRAEGVEEARYWQPRMDEVLSGVVRYPCKWFTFPKPLAKRGIGVFGKSPSTFDRFTVSTFTHGQLSYP